MQTVDWIVQSYATIYSMIAGWTSPSEASGIVGIGAAAVQVGRRSVVDLVHLMAIISVSLAVINFLPIPVVDGGHAVLLLIEKIRGKPVPGKIVAIVWYIGLAAILLLFIAVTYNDLRKLFM
jgi:regulator of sigma E protease